MNERLKIQDSELSFAHWLDEIVTLCDIHRFKFSKIGEIGFERLSMDYPLIKININPEAKIKFLLLTGTHGYEIGGPLSILRLLRKPKRYFNPLINYIIYPGVSPISFDMRQRFNDEYRDVNALYSVTLKSRN